MSRLYTLVRAPMIQMGRANSTHGNVCFEHMCPCNYVQCIYYLLHVFWCVRVCRRPPAFYEALDTKLLSFTKKYTTSHTMLYPISCNWACVRQPHTRLKVLKRGSMLLWLLSSISHQQNEHPRKYCPRLGGPKNFPVFVEHTGL